MKPNDKSAFAGAAQAGFKGGPTAHRTTPVVNKGALASAADSDHEFRGGPSKSKPGETGAPDATMAGRSDSSEFRGGPSPEVGNSAAKATPTASRGGSPITGHGKTMATDPKKHGPVTKAIKVKAHVRQVTQPSRRAAPTSTAQTRAAHQVDPTQSPGQAAASLSQADGQYGDPGMEDNGDQDVTDDTVQPPPMGGSPDDGGAEPDDGGPEPDADDQGGAAPPGATGNAAVGTPDDPQSKELFDLAVARSLQALTLQGQNLDTALKADPVKACVAFGTAAVHTVSMAADKAGKPIPFAILVQVGMQVIKIIGTIANEKGYLPDAQIPVFLKESFQQSLQKFAMLDIQAGKMTPQQFGQVQQKLMGSMGGQAQPPAGNGALAQAGAMPPPQAPIQPPQPGAMQ